jgi:hypothetical protein
MQKPDIHTEEGCEKLTALVTKTISFLYHRKGVIGTETRHMVRVETGYNINQMKLKRNGSTGDPKADFVAQRRG